METITINGVDYVKASDKPTGNRAVVVVDRGWIFTGDVERKNGRLILTNATWVYRWESIGFDGVIANPENYKVKLKKLDNPVDIPESSEIFSVPASYAMAMAMSMAMATALG